jgi:formylglycine-generating enzyme required for sulfatase activity
MAYIKGGTFQMGSNNGEADEKPVHSVTVSSFCMDKTEFTNKNRDDVKAKNPNLGSNLTWPQSSVNFNAQAQPLVTINWFEADAICKKQGKRLPTEAEWEYAARGGVSTCEYGTFQCAAPTSSNACWSCENGTCNKTSTCTVMSYSANAFGLYDMSGNVWEWVADWYNAYPGGSIGAVPANTYRVVRGGSWSNYFRSSLRATNRGYNEPGNRLHNFGFRCVSLPQDS